MCSGAGFSLISVPKLCLNDFILGSFPTGTTVVRVRDCEGASSTLMTPKVQWGGWVKFIVRPCRVNKLILAHDLFHGSRLALLAVA